MNQDQRTREQPATGNSAQANERRHEWGGATPFARYLIEVAFHCRFDPSIRALHTIETPPADIKRKISQIACDLPAATERAARRRIAALLPRLIR
jgi:hypothetical protein